MPLVKHFISKNLLHCIKQNLILCNKYKFTISLFIIKYMNLLLIY